MTKSLMTKWGQTSQTGKYLAPGHNEQISQRKGLYVMTLSQIFSCPALPHSQERKYQYFYLELT